LPAGNDQLTSLAWQPLPGADGAEIYPLIRKLDTISSNSYLIATCDALILIDPGGLPEQAEALAQVIGTCREEHDRPVFVFLTHAHIDHFLGVQPVPAFAHSGAVIFAVQECGALSLEKGDSSITQAGLFSTEVSPMKVALHLLTPERSACPNTPCQLAFSNSAEITITRDSAGEGSESLDRETIRFGNGPPLEVYHTPGHSPDSICLKMGSVVFCGDILFAASPGIAGIAGWSQDDLIRSLTGFEDLVAQGTTTMVCPGHGRIIPAANASRMITAVRTETVALENIAELNSTRAAMAAAYAEDCMEQINELFTIMAGRLYYVSWVADELGETDLAEKTADIISGQTIDGLMEAFQAFSKEHHTSGESSILLALKAGQVIAKLRQSFDQDRLAQIIDPGFVQRAGRLLSDYITLLRGFTPPTDVVARDIRVLTETLVTGLSVSACPDADLLSCDDDDEAFASILLARIGGRPLLEDVAVSVRAEEDREYLGYIDADTLCDLLTYILEDLTGSNASRITIELGQKERDVVLSVCGDIPPGSRPLQLKTKRFLPALCERAGGRLHVQKSEQALRFEIRVDAAA